MRKNNLGFTLVEILVAIAIIGILVTIVVIAINPLRLIQSSRDAKRKADLRNIAQALENYAVHNKGLYPKESTCDSSKGGYSKTCNTFEHAPYVSASPAWSAALITTWTNGKNWYTGPGNNTDGFVGSALVPDYTPALPVDPINDDTHYYRYEPRNSTTDPIGTNPTATPQWCDNADWEGPCSVYVITTHLEVDPTKTFACTNTKQPGGGGVDYEPVCEERNELISN